MKQQVLAQRITLPSNGDGVIEGIPNFQFTSVGDVLSRIIPLLITIAGVGLLLMILLSGFSLLTSAGDAKKMEGAKNRLTFALVGFFIIFLAYWLVQLFGIMFGLDSIKQLFGS